MASHCAYLKHFITVSFIIFAYNINYCQKEFDKLSIDFWKNHFKSLESYTDCEGLYTFEGSIVTSEKTIKTIKQSGYIALKEIEDIVYIYIQDFNNQDKNLILYKGLYFKSKGNGSYKGFSDGNEGSEYFDINLFYKDNLLVFSDELIMTDLLTNKKNVLMRNEYLGKKIVSPIFMHFLDNKFVGQGSGFLVNRNGYIDTNKHVISGGHRYDIYFKGKRYKAKYIGADPANDLALLKIELVPETINYVPCFISPQNIKLGKKIYALGYPSENILGSTIKISDGIISSINGYNNSPNVFQMSIPINPGNSGGPVINEFGAVVGVATSQLKETQNITFAIKSNEVLKFLKSQNISFCSSEKTLYDDDIFSKIGDACVVIKLYTFND